MKTEYKQTPLGRIPEEWGVERLGDLLSLCDSGTWGENNATFETGFPILRSTNIKNGKIINLAEVAYRKVPKNNVEKYTLLHGDILVTRSSGSSHLVGDIAYFDINGGSRVFLFSNYTLRLRVKKDIMIPKFLSYYLLSPNAKKILKKIFGTTTGLKNLNMKIYRGQFIPLPPLPEQHKIAEILSTIDSTIQKIDDAIAKTERLKKGLMQELLTNGIRHERFKFSKELGCEIPEEWEVVSLKDIADKDNDIIAGPFGSNLKVSDYKPEGVPIIRLQNIERNKFINKDIKYTSPEKAKELIYHSYRAGDIVLAKLGDPIGKTCIVPSFMREGIIVADVVRIRLSPRIASYFFFEYMLNSSICSIQLRKETIGSTRPRVNISQVRNLKLPRPPLLEQQKIAEILNTVDKKLELERERKDKLEKIKKGLMNDLLTGWKRVNTGV